MKTQANKLRLVLKNGLLGQVKIQELLKEVEDFKGESIYSKEQEKYIISQTMKGSSCWEFTPYNLDGDLEIVRQFSANPFTLIDLIYVQLS